VEDTPLTYLLNTDFEGQERQALDNPGIGETWGSRSTEQPLLAPPSISDT
jgi:hypothetical protein